MRQLQEQRVVVLNGTKETLSDRVESQGVKANARVICEILEREFNFEVSRSRVRLWLANMEKRYEQKTQTDQQ